MNADLAQAKAGVAEAQALFEQTKLNADMIRNITDAGAVSAQERNQVIAAEKVGTGPLVVRQGATNQQEFACATPRSLRWTTA